MPSRRAEALRLADELLENIELAEIPAIDVARKAYRLARLLDDADAMAWLSFEVGGYPDRSLPPDAWEATRRSNRRVTSAEGQEQATTTPLGQLETDVRAALQQVAAAVDAPVSITSANPHQFVAAPRGNMQERSIVRNLAGRQRATLDKVLGAIHAYVVERHQELRFGSAIESAFEVVRDDVDRSIADLVPDALQKLTTAFENAASESPENWANAAATCRRLLKAAADALRPPGEAVNGRRMGPDQYINRLVDWIVRQSDSDTAADLITADLEYLGRRLDAANDAGHKGAHEEVSRFDASRFVTGTYLLLGDILALYHEQN